MEFAPGRRLMLTVVLLCVSAAAQRGEENGQVRVLVYNNARISAGQLEKAGAETTRIFRSAGIELVWINCTANVESLACRNASRSKGLIMRVVSNGKSGGDYVYGDAFLAEDGSGKYADIFFDHIVSTHHDFGVNEARLLGAVAAHEIGHLLLGLGAHSTTGIMSPIWANAQIQKMEKGGLLFTPMQAMRMREHVWQSEFEVDDRGLDRASVDTGGRVPASEAPFAIRSTMFLTSKSCRPTLTPCP